MDIMTLPAEKIISWAKSAIVADSKYMKDWAWIFPVVMLGDTIFTDKIATAATDGLNVMYNPEYIKTLGSKEEAVAVVLHENIHKIRRHMLIYKNFFKIDQMRTNIAMDVIINNQDLHQKNGVKLGKGWVDFPKYTDSSVWTFKRIYDDLTDDDVAKYSGSEGVDVHDFNGLDGLSEEEIKEIEKKIDMAIRQASMTQASGMPREIQELTVPDVNWQDALSEFVKVHASGKDKQTWRRPHRSYMSYNLYLPDNYSEQIGGILWCMDTSGSIDNEFLSQFMSHGNNLIKEVNPKFVDVIYWGSSVVGHDELLPEYSDIFREVRPKDGGGTTPSVCADWLNKQKGKKDYVCAVVFTDGEFYGDGVGKWDIPVLWIVVNTTAPSIPVGQTIHVKPK